MSQKTRNTDNNHDWLYGGGLSNYAVKNSGVKADIKMRVWSFLNNCFFDLNNGIPWLDLLGSTGRKAEIDSEVIRTIEDTPHVIALTDFKSQVDGRYYGIQFLVLTEFGGGVDGRIDMADLMYKKGNYGRY